MEFFKKSILTLFRLHITTRISLSVQINKPVRDLIHMCQIWETEEDSRYQEGSRNTLNKTRRNQDRWQLVKLHFKLHTSDLSPILLVLYKFWPRQWRFMMIQNGQTEPGSPGLKAQEYLISNTGDQSDFFFFTSLLCVLSLLHFLLFIFTALTATSLLILKTWTVWFSVWERRHTSELQSTMKWEKMKAANPEIISQQHIILNEPADSSHKGFCLADKQTNKVFLV